MITPIEIQDVASKSLLQKLAHKKAPDLHSRTLSPNYLILLPIRCPAVSIVKALLKLAVGKVGPVVLVEAFGVAKLFFINIDNDIVVLSVYTKR